MRSDVNEGVQRSVTDQFDDATPEFSKRIKGVLEQVLEGVELPRPQMLQDIPYASKEME